jgi:hypothetical protein
MMIFGLFQHPVIEFQPTQFLIEIQIGIIQVDDGGFSVLLGKNGGWGRFRHGG